MIDYRCQYDEMEETLFLTNNDPQTPGCQDLKTVPKTYVCPNEKCKKTGTLEEIRKHLRNKIWCSIS